MKLSDDLTLAQVENLFDFFNEKVERARIERAVAISDDGLTVAVGCPCLSLGLHRRGYVLVYSYDTDEKDWFQAGNRVVGSQVSSLFGFSIALAKRNGVLLLAIGAPGTDTATGYDTGQVVTYVHDTDSDEWIKFAQSLDGILPNNLCGYAVDVSLNGERLAYGCPGASSATENFDFVGRVEIADWKATRGAWMSLRVRLEDSGRYYQAGRAVSLSGDGHRVAFSGAVPTRKEKSVSGIFVYEEQKRETLLYGEPRRDWVPYGSFIPHHGTFLDRVAVATSRGGNIVAIGVAGSASKGHATTYKAIHKGSNYSYYFPDWKYHY